MDSSEAASKYARQLMIVTWCIPQRAQSSLPQKMMEGNGNNGLQELIINTEVLQGCFPTKPWIPNTTHWIKPIQTQGLNCPQLLNLHHISFYLLFYVTYNFNIVIHEDTCISYDNNI